MTIQCTLFYRDEYKEGAEIAKRLIKAHGVFNRHLWAEMSRARKRRSPRLFQGMKDEMAKAQAQLPAPHRSTAD